MLTDVVVQAQKIRHESVIKVVEISGSREPRHGESWSGESDPGRGKRRRASGVTSMDSSTTGSSPYLLTKGRPHNTVR